MKIKKCKKKKLTLYIEEELLNDTRPYIDNISAYLNACLRQFYNKNKKLIMEDKERTAQLIIDRRNQQNDGDKNITSYYTNQQKTQFMLFPILNNKYVCARKQKVIVYPCDDFLFLSNSECIYKKEHYYFIELNNNQNIKQIKNEELDESVKWW